LIALAITAGTIGGAVGMGASSANAAAPCDLSTWHGLFANANLNYVSAEVNYQASNTNGMLRARSTTQGPWEQFQFIKQSDGHFAIKSLANGKYVSAELGYPATSPYYGMLRARATTVGKWEKFDGVLGFGCSIKSVGNGKLVSAEIGYQTANYGMLRARSSKQGPWEVFFPTNPSPCVNPFHAGESWGLERTDRGVDYGAHGSQPVRAICDGTILSLHVSGWGAFIDYKLSSGPWTGKCIYQAEEINVASNLHVGSVVHASDVLGYAYNQVEWGLGEGHRRTFNAEDRRQWPRSSDRRWQGVRTLLAQPRCTDRRGPGTGLAVRRRFLLTY
jgi:hypothetical protein